VRSVLLCLVKNRKLLTCTLNLGTMWLGCPWGWWRWTRTMSETCRV